MRLPRTQFTIRRLMAAVAVVSLALGTAVALQRRRADLRYRAESYSREASRQYMIGQIVTQATHFGPSPMELRMQEAHYNLGDYFTGLEEKYTRAAARPWLPVAADPPPPVWPSGVPHYVPPKVRR